MRTYKIFPRCIITEFECIVDVQTHEFGWERFQAKKNNMFLILIFGNIKLFCFLNDTRNQDVILFIFEKCTFSLE